MSAVALLCELIAQGAKVSVETYGAHPEFAMLLRGGLLRKSGVVQSVACLECGNSHDAQIVHQDGSYGYFCPDLGFVSIERAEIEAAEPNFSTIVAGLADTLDCKRRKSTPLKGATWRIGTITSEGGDVSIYLHPSLRGEQDAANIVAALSGEVKTPYRLILTAGGRLPIPGATTALLSDMFEIATGGKTFTVLADPRDIVEAPRKKPGGAPNRYKDVLIPLIQTRIEQGIACEGRNAEAKAVLALLREKGIHQQLPSLSSVKDYVSKCRAGQ